MGHLPQFRTGHDDDDPETFLCTNMGPMVLTLYVRVPKGRERYWHRQPLARKKAPWQSIQKGFTHHVLGTGRRGGIRSSRGVLAKRLQKQIQQDRNGSPLAFRLPRRDFVFTVG